MGDCYNVRKRVAVAVVFFVLKGLKELVLKAVNDED